MKMENLLRTSGKGTSSSGFTGNKSGFGKERHDTSGESIQGNPSRERRTEASVEKETGEQKEYRKEVCGRERRKKDNKQPV